MENDTKIFSMFSGIGGFELGFLMSGKNVKFVGYSEIDKYAIQIFEKQFKGIKNYGDATTINEARLPGFSLLVGGFPCQSFSIAGRHKGFNDTRGTLFFDIARILEHKKPKYFILENVRGLLSHDSGRTFQTILKVLSDIGYLVQWEVLNSKNYGVPQNRERVYIVGHLRGNSRPEVFPIKKVDEKDSKSNQQKIKILDNLKGEGGHECHNVHDVEGIAPTVRENHGKITMIETDSKPNEITKNLAQAYRVYDTNGVSTTLGAVGGGIGAKTGLYQVGVIKNRGKIVEREKSTCLDANYWKGLDNHGGRTGIMVNSNIRRLTPLECERLQGFPDRWTEGISDTQRYKCLGNAVTTTVVCEIAKKLLK